MPPSLSECILTPSLDVYCEPANKVSEDAQEETNQL